MKRGPKLTLIDWTEFDKLCEFQCTLTEIASWFGCCEDTIETAVLREQGMKFSEYFDIHRGKGKIAIRRKQFQVAMGGDRYMLVWLGKQYLDQADTIRTIDESIAQPIQINIQVEDARRIDSEGEQATR